jgi:hypothetical protein
MRRFRRMVMLAASGLSAVALAATMAGPAQAAGSAGWRVAYRHHYGAAANYGSYFSVIAPGKSDAWAFGTANEARNGPPRAVRWNGRHWRFAALPAGLTYAVGAASAVSRSDIWAVSQFGQYVLHWNGTKWSVAKRWKGTGLLLTGVTALSRTNVWVFGTSGEGPGLGTWHYNGRTWKHITGIGGTIVSASAVSARRIWAVGSTAKGPNDVIVRYNGTRWRQTSVHAPKGEVFASVLAISRTDVWADSVSTDSPRHGHLLKWNGKSWRSLEIPWQADPGPLVSDGHGGLWVQAEGGAQPTTWMLHRTRSGTWTRTRISSGHIAIWDLARVPGSDLVLGAGEIATKVSSDAAVYAHGSAG